MKNKIPKTLEKKLAKADKDKIDTHLKYFDRILLFNMAAHLLPVEARQEIVNMWQERMKDVIDEECNLFTTYLQETPHGRTVSMLPQQEDGEDMRLNFLEALDVANEIVGSNLFAGNQMDEGEDGELSH